MGTDTPIERLQPVERTAPGLLRTIREALRGSRHDFTAGSLGRSIFLLAVPMVMEMAMESLFAVVDVFFVSRLGADAVATVGITESIMSLIYAVDAGLSMAAAAMVARRIGEKEPERAAAAAVQAVALGVLIALPLGVAGILFSRDLLGLMGASPTALSSGYGYTSVMIGGNITVLLLFLMNAILRGSGDAAAAMRVLWFANIINIILDPCLIFGLGPFPELGVTGAAVATNIGRGSAVVYQVVILVRGQGRIAVRRSHVRLEPAVMWRLLKISGNGILQVLVATASWLGLVRVLALFGSAAVAGYTIGLRIIIFALLPSWGMSNAAATMVGQSLGAGKPERGERAVWLACLYNMVFLGVVGLLFVLFAEPLIRLFSADPAVHPIGVRCLRYISCGFLFYACGMVVTQAFNGAGDTFTPTLINLVCFWLCEIPLAFVLSVSLELGPTGVFVAITIAFSLLAVVSAAIFRRGRWKKVRV